MKSKEEMREEALKRYPNLRDAKAEIARTLRHEKRDLLLKMYAKHQAVLQEYNLSLAEARLKRAVAMKDLRMTGMTLEEIGKQFNMTRERVRQILWASFGSSFSYEAEPIIKSCEQCEKVFTTNQKRQEVL